MGAFLIMLLLYSAAAYGQTPSPQKPLELTDGDRVPVILKHLPDYDAVKANARFINNAELLRETVGDRPILGNLTFGGGTEAAFAQYAAGELLIIEFTNPQGSIDFDSTVTTALAQTPDGRPTAYRRVGNYNVFVFDGADSAAAEALIDQIKYEKLVQWLGDDPYLLKRLERYMVSTARDIFISTVQVIVFGILGSIVVGIIAGFAYFRVRDQRRVKSAAFSDAGGLTRLNIDDLTSEVRSEPRSLTA